IKFSKDPIYEGKKHAKDNLHRTKSLLVGALVSASEYLKLAGQLANSDAKRPVKTPDWPELAVFDCYACHHELKNAAWRQTRESPGGAPGRPALQEWHFILARIALKTGGDSDLDGKMSELRQALARQPFGTKAAVSKATGEAATSLSAAGEKLQLRSVTRDDG